MAQGVIKRLNDKGFGFIAVEGEEKDYFFHATELTNAEFNDLREGDTLEFEVAQGEKGPQAVNVSKA
jgi:CspA family cold shock protein